MALQILGGIAQRLTLKVPPKDTIRPMAAQLKRRLFDANQHLAGRQFVDLCAGSGAVGIEAWSRGADKVLLNEKSNRVQKFTQDNLKLIKEKFPEAIVERPINFKLGDALSVIKSKEWDREEAIMFFAPPYPIHDLYRKACIHFNEYKNAELWIESDRQKGLDQKTLIESMEGLGEPTKIYEQGTTFVLVYKR